MKTILVQRKFSMHSKFLDTTLQSEDELFPGESKEDAIIRVYEELGAIADKIRKDSIIQETLIGARDNFPPIGPPMPQQIPVISRDLERLEILIDNAESVEELKIVKKYHELMPASCLTQYNKKMQDLTTGRPGNFTEGLE